MCNVVGGRRNAVHWASGTATHNLATDGAFTAGNTDRVFRLHGDGYWQSWRPGRSINAFSTLPPCNGSAGPRAGRMLLIDALADVDFNADDQQPPWACDDMTPDWDAMLDAMTLADDVSPWVMSHGNDKVPNFALFSGTVVNSTQSGNWSSPSTWGGATPAAGNVVRIRSGHAVTYDSNATTRYKVVSVENGGTLAFSVAGDTQLWVQHFLVRERGTLTLGTAASPVPHGTTAQVVFANVALDTANDPAQFGNGLVCLGTLRVCGLDRGPSFVRAAGELASAGATSVTLGSAVADWKAGDKLVFPDTRHLGSSDTFAAQLETRTLSSLSGGNATLNFSALTYAHKGPRDYSGTLLTARLWHVANVTRNVVFRSEDASGVPGHVLCSMRADVDVRNALFYELGRTTSSPLDSTTFSGDTATHVGTNQIGRYPLHLHHVGGRAPQANGRQFTVTGCAVDGGTNLAHTRKWGVTVHGSHFGLVQNNVVYNARGGGFVVEDGSETENLFDRNMAAYVPGPGGREDADDVFTGFARNGGGFWMRSGLSRYTGNVAANCGGYGVIHNAIYLDPAYVPTYQGSYRDDGGLYAWPGQVGNRQNEGFETYGNGTGGVTYWWWNNSSDNPRYQSSRALVKGCVVWHVKQLGVYAYPGCHQTWDGLEVYGDPALLTGSTDQRAFTWEDDYRGQNVRIVNATVHNMKLGIECSPDLYDTLLVEDCEVRCGVGVKVQTPVAAGTSGDQSAAVQRERVVTVRGCTLTPVSGSVNFVGPESKREVWTDYGPGSSTHGNYVVRCQTYVLDRDGVAGDDYRVYHPDAARAATLAQSTSTRYACPEAGLTNQQAHDKYQPWAPGYTGLNVPPKVDYPNPATPGLCFGGDLPGASATTAAWTNGLVEAL